MRIGHGHDIHALEDGRPLVLAGLVLDPSRGPRAHSDGDVLCHALSDALLGAAALGDLGEQFPVDDPRWRNAPGLEILGRTRAILGDHGFRVSQVDVTLLLEQPKLSHRKLTIREALAMALELPADRVGLKAGTAEGLGPVGRGEAIEAHAVVLVEDP